MHKSLFLRTEVLPEEIPILLSNKNVYLAFHKKRMGEYSKVNQAINSIVTIPYHFEIPKDKYSERKMSLLHPLAQLQTYIYTLTYEHLIIEFCSRSKFSSRSPSKLNSFKFDQIKGLKAMERKLNESYSFTKKINVSSEEDKALFFNYYSYSPYKNVNELHNSPKFNRQKYKYDFFIKLDIQDFFPSIYSHGIAWAIFGDKSLAKKYRYPRYKDVFANATDNIAQLINFNETNGLIIGPEFARVIAELLLTRVDMKLYRELKNDSIIINRDYVINRYIDDFYIFTNKEQTAIKIEKQLSEILLFYNLKLNVHKREVQKRPFKIYNRSIVKLKSVLAEFNTNNFYSFIRYQDNITKLLKFEQDEKEKKKPLYIPGTKHNWEALFYQIEKLIYETGDDSRQIVNYFLKAIRNHVVYTGGQARDFRKIIEIVTSVYSLDINYKSTYSIIAIYIKVWMDIKSIEAKSIKNLEPTMIDLENLKESVFHNIYTVLKNNFGEIDQMYDLIVFMKQIDKPLDSQFLCKILNGYKGNYFVLCSVAYYILNEDLTTISYRYKTVHRVLKENIQLFHENYKSLGSRHKGLEGHYFYIINDFSHYPGFESSFRSSLGRSIASTFERHLKSEVNKGKDFDELKQKIVEEDKLEQFKTGRENIMKDIWGYVTQRSYFQWKQNAEDFSRKIVIKTTNVSFNNSEVY